MCGSGAGRRSGGSPAPAGGRRFLRAGRGAPRLLGGGRRARALFIAPGSDGSAACLGPPRRGAAGDRLHNRGRRGRAGRAGSAGSPLALRRRAGCAGDGPGRPEERWPARGGPRRGAGETTACGHRREGEREGSGVTAAAAPLRGERGGALSALEQPLPRGGQPGLAPPVAFSASFPARRGV